MTVVLQFIIEFVVAIFATLSFAILFCAPKKELHYCGFTGGVGWIIYYIVTYFGANIVIASVLATFFVTIFARIFAIIRKNPATIYLLTGIFPIVPGAGIFYTAYYLFNDDSAMSSIKGVETFEVACAIVLGIIFGFAIPQGLVRKLKIFQKKPK